MPSKWFLIGAAGVGAMLLMGSRGSGPEVTTSFTPAVIGADELVSANKYRLIESRRSGMAYIPVTKGALGGVLEFTSPKSGKFTWNVIQEGGSLLAEVASY